MANLALSEISRSPPWHRRLIRFCRQQPLGAASLLIILVLLVVSILAEHVAPYDPVAVDFVDMLKPPNAAHLLGTDSYGRDILSRLIYGARTALIIGITSSLIGCGMGAILGTASAYFGGTIDEIIMRVVEIVLSIPLIIAALVVVAVLGRHVVLGLDLNLILAIAIPFIPRVARVVRSAALSIRGMLYIDAARAAGYSHARIILRHMAPNLTAPFLIALTAAIAQAILLEASLSFLGLGVTEPTPAWGLMLAGTASDYFRVAPWIILFPGAAISLAVFAFNLFGDAMRDWLDPKFKL